ncbi:MAG: hypothetical protein WCI87_04415 [Euryarchaeota archaeon]
MKKQVSVFLIAAAVLTAVFVAGCTSQTASPTPSPTTTANATTASVKPIAPTALPNSTDLSSFWTSYMQDQGYTVVIPFNKSVSNTTGNDQYVGALTDGKYVFGAKIEITKSSADAESAFTASSTALQQQGFTPQETNSTSWIGVNSNDGYVAYVTQDPTDNFVVTLVVTSIGSG